MAAILYDYGSTENPHGGLIPIQFEIAADGADDADMTHLRHPRHLRPAYTYAAGRSRLSLTNRATSWTLKANMHHENP